MLDKDTIDYIMKHYTRFMTLHELATIKQQGLQEKHPNSVVSNLLKNGYEHFRAVTAMRTLAANFNHIYFNRCPTCNQLARTPQARQCRFCGTSWRHLIVATFLIEETFELTGRGFFLLGTILSGTIKIGMRADLTTLSLNSKSTIVALDFARNNENRIISEKIGLRLGELSQGIRDFLKINSPFSQPICIESEVEAQAQVDDSKTS